MYRLSRALIVSAVMALLVSRSIGYAQQNVQLYQPLSNSEMSPSHWSQWLTTFNAMTANQKAEVVRRHLKMCLDSTELTDAQRSFVTDVTAKVNGTMYDADPDKRAAKQRELEAMEEKAKEVLGPQLTFKFFVAKPPISLLEAVKNDPTVK